jgi:hypothetical protein
MRRFFKTILLLAVFLAGYYVGHLPGSPDIFAGAEHFYQRVDRTTTEISEKARDEDISWAEAAACCLLAEASDEVIR